MKRRIRNPRGRWSLCCLLAGALSLVFAQEPSDVDLEDADLSRINVEGLPGPADLSYLGLPGQASPLDHMLPAQGVDESKGVLKVPENATSYDHRVDYQSRQVEVTKKVRNLRSGKETPLWTGNFGDLGDYAIKMNELALRRLWLNSLIGQEKSDAPDEESTYDLDIPIKLPAWLKKFELDKPKLELEGSMVFSVSGRGKKISGSPSTSLWPGFTPDFEPSMRVKGRVGRYITIEVATSDEFSIRNDIKVRYGESKPGEFEDHILQEVEAGNTSLSLPGTELTGYSENHKGLFGVKSRWKIGPVDVTAIASQEGGSQENYTINPQSTTSEYTIRDKDFVAYKHYFLTRADREEWVKAAVKNRKPTTDNKPGLVLYTIANATSAAKSGNVVREVTAVYWDANGRRQTYRTNMTLRKMQGGTGAARSGQEWTWDPERRTVTLLRGSRDGFYAATWSSPDGLSVGGAGISNGGTVVVFKTERDEIDVLQELMQRNRYNVGSGAKQSGFTMRVVNAKGASSNPQGVSNLTLLGLADEEGKLYRSDREIFTDDGELVMPCQENPPFPDSSRGVPADWAERACLEPFLVLDTASADIYSSKIRNISRVESRYSFAGTAKRRQTTLRVSESQSVSSGGCVDIAEGSEKLKIGSTTLQRGIDYEVVYELGQIELISERAKDPNSEISVSYECEPLFRIENKFLFGVRGELPFRKLGEGSHFGATFLYRSQNTSENTPHYGREPFSSVLWGANLRLTDGARWMDVFTNGIPFVDTKKSSRWLFEAEIARSYHNPNTKGSALLDDFESSRRELPFPLRRTAWRKASPPGGARSYLRDETTDWRHQGDFVWHSNTTIDFSRIYGNTGSSSTDRQDVGILQFNLAANDNLQGRSWGGVMRANSDYYADMGTYRYVELVVRGSQGAFYVDFGRVSEDVSVNGEEPNGVLNSEGNLYTGTQEHDYGLDGVPSSQETATRWECNGTSCTGFAVSGTADPAGDDYEYDAQKDASNPDRRINGTEGNNNDAYAGRGFDTEDLDGSGSLDVDEEFVRYRIDLGEGYGYEELRNGWRRYRIPLEDFHEVVSGEGASATDILGNAAFTRIWVGDLPAGVANATVQLARFAVVGNQWEGSERSSLYETPADVNTQRAVAGGSTVDVDYGIPSATPDSNALKVRVVNTRDDIGAYFMSPHVTAEEDGDGVKQREQSLALEFTHLHPGQNVTATRFFDSEEKDLTQYTKMSMEIHLDQDPGATAAGRMRFALQLGRGSLTGGSEYYEWSFRPEPSSCSSLQSEKDRRDCHERNWRENRFTIDLDEWTGLKADRNWTPDGALWKMRSGSGDTVFLRREALEDRLVATRADTANDPRREVLGVVGNPNLGKINWIRFVVSVDKDLPASETAEGEIWVDDLKLRGVRSGWGSAGRVAAQLDFGDVITLSGDAHYQDGAFAPLNASGASGLPTLAEAASTLDYRGDLKFQLNKFFPDAWKLQMPLSFGYGASAERPWLKPESDVDLSHDDMGDFGGDLFFLDSSLRVRDTSEERRLRERLESKGWQSWTENRTIAFSYRKDHVKSRELWREALGQIFFERPQFGWRWTNRTFYGPKAIDTTNTWNTTIRYNFGQLGPQKRRFFNPWPETFDVTLLDFSFTRTKARTRDPERIEETEKPVSEALVDLNHSANVNWNVFSFLNLGYSIDIYRDMRGDAESFGRENLFSTSSPGGFLGWKKLVATDESDWDVESAEDTVVTYDTLASNTGADSIVERRSSSYRVTDARKRSLGEDYGILSNERNRRQTFKIGLQPKLFEFLEMRANYQSDFTLEKTIPDGYDPWNPKDLDANYWTAGRVATFDFRPRLRMNRIFPKARGWQAALRKISLNTVDFNWKASVSDQGEDFRLNWLHDSTSMGPGDWWLWGLGLSDGDPDHPVRNPWDIVTGDGLKTNDPNDWTAFGDYMYDGVDSLVFRNKFRTTVSREAGANTAVTLPFWKIRATGNVKWKHDFTQYRAQPLQEERHWTWPWWSVSFNVPDVHAKFGVTKKHLSKLTFETRFTYERDSTAKPYASSEDLTRRTYSFDPLLKASLTTAKRKIGVVNGFSVKYETGWRRPKIDPFDGEYTQKLSFSAPWRPPAWIYTDLVDEDTWTLRDRLEITYDLNVNKGIQLLKWYFRLKNPIRLALGFDFERILETRRDYIAPSGFDPLSSDGPVELAYVHVQPDGTRVPVNQVDADQLEPTSETVPTDSWLFTVRPSARYQFTKKIEGEAWLEYSWYRSESASSDDNLLEQTLSYSVRVQVNF